MSEELTDFETCALLADAMLDADAHPEDVTLDKKMQVAIEAFQKRIRRCRLEGRGMRIVK